MTLESDMLTKSIAVPAWLVYLCSSVGIVLCGTVGGIIVQDRGQIHTLSNVIAEVRSANTELRKSDDLQNRSMSRTADAVAQLNVAVTDLRTEVRLLNQQRGIQ